MVNLRNICSEDLAQIKHWAGQEEYEDYFRRYPPLFSWPVDPPTLMAWFPSTYVIRDEDAVIGLLQFCNPDQFSKQVELGILVDKAQPKRAAIAIEACHLGFEYFFDYLGFERIYCRILAHRPNISLLLRQNEFQEEGVLRNNCFFKGEFHDEIILSLLREEYSGRLS